MAHVEKVQNTVILGFVVGALSVIAGQLTGAANALVVTVAISAVFCCLTISTVAAAVGRIQNATFGIDELPVIPGLRRKKRARGRVCGALGNLALISLVAAAVHAVAITIALLPRIKNDPNLPAAAGSLAVLLIVAAVMYARAMKGVNTAITWLCPNASCASRHISERHSWRCAFCVGLNNTVSMLEGCTCGDCRELPSGYVCPSCSTRMLFEHGVDPRYLATAAHWSPPKEESPRQYERRQLQAELQEVAEEEQLLKMRELRDAGRNRLAEAGKPREEPKVRNVRDVFRKRSQPRMEVMSAYHEERQLIIETYPDPRTQQQALHDLDDDLEHELDKLRRRVNDDKDA